jgi:hypothetical protein
MISRSECRGNDGLATTMPIDMMSMLIGVKSLIGCTGHETDRHREYRAAIGCRAGHQLRTDHAVRPEPVLDQHGLPQLLRHSIPHLAHGDAQHHFHDADYGNRHG